jgi:hypothetical protein
MINIEFNNVYRLTGNPENFITAATGGFWGLKEDLHTEWSKLVENDLLLFHASIHSSYRADTLSTVIGWARVGQIQDRTPLDPGVPRSDSARRWRQHTRRRTLAVYFCH